MSDCFISYRRTPSAPVATGLQALLASQHNIDAYVDTTRTDGTTVRFPQRLMTAIEAAPVFVCLLGERDGQHTLESEWVLKEIQRAYDLGKFCIPVFQESYRPLPDMPPAVDYLLSHDGVHILDQKNIMIDASVRELANLIRPHMERRRSPLLAGVGVLAVLGVLAVAGWVLFGNNGSEGTPTPEATSAPEVGMVASDTPPPMISPPEVTTTVPDVAEEPIETPTASAAGNLTAPPTESPTPSTATTTQTPTDTPTATPTATRAPEQIAQTPQPSNAAWQPHITERDFDGVTMVLVPAGSFEMGSTDDEIDQGFEMCQQAADNDAECQRSWFEDEAPNGDNTQTFTEPFWIDKHEVTREQYEACVAAGVCEETPDSDFSTAGNQPINRVTWFQADTYCQEWRDGRLPTEAEWEYAARGPDRLIFPWGNAFDGELANHCDSNCGAADWASNFNYVNEENDDGFAVTAPVDSFDNASWVGALDMSGNVWEWTSSLYEDYPYAPDHESNNNDNSARVLRGGSFYNTSSYLRSANRGLRTPSNDINFIGFRCVLS